MRRPARVFPPWRARWSRSTRAKASSSSPACAFPSITTKYMLDGTVQAFYLWDPIKLGYVTYYAARYLSEGKIQGKIGDSFEIKDGKWPGKYRSARPATSSPAGRRSSPRTITRSIRFLAGFCRDVGTGRSGPPRRGTRRAAPRRRSCLARLPSDGSRSWRLRQSNFAG